MPTGYTAPVYDNKPIDAVELASNFARGLGFTIHQRDEHQSAPPRWREPSEYLYRRVKELERERERLLSLDDEEAEGEYQAHINEVNAYNEEASRKWQDMRNRYINAIRVFNQWKPKTESGKKVKEFALSQLKESKDFDARPGGPYHIPITVSSPSDYISEKLAENAQALDRSNESLYDEEQRCLEANRWIKDFYSDVKQLEGIRMNDGDND